MGLTPHEEARSLEEYPLPVLITEEDKHLPTTLNQIDTEISKVEEQLKQLRQKREDTVKRILETKITEDSFYVVKENTRSTRSVNIDKFKVKFPGEYENICNIIKLKIKKEMAKIGNKIDVGLVDTMIKKEDSIDCMDITIKTTYTTELKK